MGHLRMTVLARGKRALIVAGVTGEAAQAFVNAHRSAIVSRSHLRTPMIGGSSGACLRLPRGVALIAQTLTCVRTDFHGPGAVRELRKRERGGGEVHSFASIEDGKRRWDRGAGNRDARGWLRLWHAFVMHLVAGLAWHGWLLGKPRTRYVPRASGVLRLNQIAYRAVKMHAVTAEAILHQVTLAVVDRIGKYPAVCCTVRTGLPVGVFVLMALLATGRHG